MLSIARSSTFYWALVGVFAALHLVMTMLPLFLLASGEGFISLGLVTAVVIGFLLGPVYGAFSVFIGSALGVFIFNVGGILGPIIPVVAPTAGALIAGSLRTEKTIVVILIYSLSITAYLVSPIGGMAYIYIWLHLVAMLLAVLFILPKTKQWLRKEMHYERMNPEYNFLTLWLLSFIALLADSVVGGSLGVYYFVYALNYTPELVAGWFTGVAFIYPLERIAVTFVITSVLLAIIKTVAGSEIGSLLGISKETSEYQTAIGTRKHPDEYKIHRDEAS